MNANILNAGKSTARTPREVVVAFWEKMQSNDFTQVSLLLAEVYVLYYPQSNETFRGHSDFIRLNSTYPAQGRWQFTVHSLVAEGSTVVSDVGVTDGVANARVVNFSKVENGLITEGLEFWPELFDPPEWRRSWTRGD